MYDENNFTNSSSDSRKDESDLTVNDDSEDRNGSMGKIGVCKETLVSRFLAAVGAVTLKNVTRSLLEYAIVARLQSTVPFIFQIQK